MPLMNSKTINSKTLKMEFKKTCQNMAYLFTEILIIGWHRDIRVVVCKNRAEVLKIEKLKFSKLTQNIGMNGLS